MLNKQNLKELLGKRVYIPQRNDYGIIIAIDTKAIDTYMEVEPFAIMYENYKDTGTLTLIESINFENTDTIEYIGDYKLETNWDWFFMEDIEIIDMDVKIKYHNKNMPKLVHEKNKRIDLRANKIYLFDHKTKEKTEYIWNEENKIKLKAGKSYFVDLGISMELPFGYEAEITPRSSLYKNHGLILTNSPGIIDNDYNGNNDIWGALFYCVFDTEIEEFERLLQFTIRKEMNKINFVKVENLKNKDRGGYGSSGRK